MCRSERCKKVCGGLVVVLIAVTYMFLLLFTLGLLGFGCNNSDLRVRISKISGIQGDGYEVIVSCMEDVNLYEQSHSSCLNAVEKIKVFLMLPKHEFVSVGNKIYTVGQARCQVYSTLYYNSTNWTFQTLIILDCLKFFREFVI